MYCWLPISLSLICYVRTSDICWLARNAYTHFGQPPQCVEAANMSEQRYIHYGCKAHRQLAIGE